MDNFNAARSLLHKFKGDAYIHGLGVLPQTGELAAQLGKRAALVRDSFPGAESLIETITASLLKAGVELCGTIQGASPNAPREDVQRIRTELARLNPELVISFGGGSTIDAVKAASVLSAFNGDVEQFFGTGLVTQLLRDSQKKLLPHLAIQTAASSSAHLTKYSNITDLSIAQKKLIVDDAIVPPRAIFDYEVTFDAPLSLTADGAMDGFSHCLEVLYSAVGKPNYAQIRDVAQVGISLVAEYLPSVIRQSHDPEGREGLGLATDLGGYSIMLGGTNGAHLTSFSLVDVLSHGRACAMLNPYYTVFFAPAIQEPLRMVGSIFHAAGFITTDLDRLHGRELGLAVAEGMLALEQSIGFPYRLSDVPGFSDEHISRALTAAKNPQLKMKLENMPVPLTAETVDEYMLPILEAAKTGQLANIKNVP
jgi:alcohol dehydrogenase class IV